MVEEREPRFPSTAEAIPHLLTAFPAALRQVVDNPAHTVAVNKFKQTYMYRRSFPFLGESGQLPGVDDGLTYAMIGALVLYDFEREPEADDIAPEWLSGDNDPVDSEFKNALILAAEKVTQDRLTMDQFADALDQNGVDVRSVMSDQLSTHVAHAFNQYVVWGDAGTSGDPW